MNDQAHSGIVGQAAAILSTMPPRAWEYRLAGTLILVSLLVFLGVAPFASVHLGKYWAFIPVYESALVINDFITAVLLFGQLLVNRTRSLLALVCAYLFTAMMAIVHALSFPGLFSEAGLFGSGPQTTAWLYMFWHAGFPLGVMAYVRLSGSLRDTLPRVMFKVTITLATVVLALTLLATAGSKGVLPAIMRGNGYTPIMTGVTSAVWALSMLALWALWPYRRRSVLDMWLVVVLCAWICDIGLSAVFNAGRFDLGFYAGRIFGLLGASFVLCALLIESGWLYLRLLETTRELERLNAVDPLTGIANRRAFDDALAAEWRRAVRNHSQLSLLMIDVDYFKQYNDHYGHVLGDECLKAIGAVLGRAAQRSGELAARYGGEEFVALLPYLDMHDVLGLAERIRQAVAELAIPHARSKVAANVTLSIGVASIRPASVEAGVLVDGKVSVEPVALVAAADEALYAAKEAGRNRVSVSGVAGEAALAT